MSENSKYAYLVKRIGDARRMISENGGYDEFYRFVQKKYNSTDGLSKSYMSKILTLLKDLPTDDQVEHFEQSIKNFEEKAKTFTCRDPDNSALFYSTQWYVYFHYKNSLLNPNVSLGRAVLSIDDDGIVNLKNIDDNVSCDYEGRFELFSDYLMILDLDGNIPGYRLQMKIITGEKPKEVSVGISLIYEKQHVLSNMIVLENKTGKEIYPAILSNLSPVEEGKDTSEYFKVPLAIRKFLALRNKSVLKAPSEIYNLNILSKWVDTYEERKRNCAFDFDETGVFIASPTDSIEANIQNSKKKSIKEIIKSVQKGLENIGGEVKFHYPGEFDLASTTNKSQYSQEIVENLKSLRYMKFFILIYDEMVVSRSLIELGYALANCRCVLLLYNNEISNSIEDLTTRISTFPKALSVLSNNKAFQVFQMDSFNGNVSKQKDKIAESIYSFIAVNYNDIYA